MKKKKKKKPFKLNTSILNINSYFLLYFILLQVFNICK